MANPISKLTERALATPANAISSRLQQLRAGSSELDEYRRSKILSPDQLKSVDEVRDRIYQEQDALQSVATNLRKYQLTEQRPTNATLSGLTQSYTGGDIRAIVNLAGKPHTLGTLMTISYSIHREKVPVRRLGQKAPTTYTRGTKSIAGSMIFSTLNKHVLLELNGWSEKENKKGADTLKAYPDPLSTFRTVTDGTLGPGPKDIMESMAGASITADIFPPFDVVLNCHNEFGTITYMAILGIQIMDEGQTFSIDDLVSENTFTYVATDIIPMVSAS